jgi:hypothetical protein
MWCHRKFLIQIPGAKRPFPGMAGILPAVPGILPGTFVLTVRPVRTECLGQDAQDGGRDARPPREPEVRNYLANFCDATLVRSPMLRRS